MVIFLLVIITILLNIALGYLKMIHDTQRLLADLAMAQSKILRLLLERSREPKE